MNCTEQSVNDAFTASGRKSSRSGQNGNCVEVVVLEQ